MSKCYDKTVIGIDVASEFSKAAILSPRGDIYKNSFKIVHSLNGFNYFITQIKKAEIESITKQINLLKKEICAFIKSNEIPESFRNNIKLIDSIGGIGEFSAISLMAEIGEISNFKSPKQLLAYLGIDPAVNESGKFKGDRNKMSKRGSRIARRVLYSVSIAIIAKKVNDALHNSSLYSYYQKLLLQGKKKKVAIGAVMHKLVNYIFAVGL